MKMRIVSTKNEIEGLGTKETVVHLAFRPSNQDVFDIVKKCPKLKGLHIPESYHKTVSASARSLLEMQNITLIKGDVWGHRKDINDYSEISTSVFERIKEYQGKGMDTKKIAKLIAEETGISDEFAVFIINQNT
jgi:hypothetical protein